MLENTVPETERLVRKQTDRAKEKSQRCKSKRLTRVEILRSKYSIHQIHYPGGTVPRHVEVIDKRRRDESGIYVTVSDLKTVFWRK